MSRPMRPPSAIRMSHGPATGPWPGPPTAEHPAAVDEPPTDVIELPGWAGRPRIAGGPDADDAPYASPAPPVARYHAWVHVLASRAMGYGLPLATLEVALAREVPRLWGLWWATRPPGPDRWVRHRARVVAHDAGETLVSACGLSEAWNPHDDRVLIAAEHPDPWPTLPGCTVCTELSGDPRTVPGAGR